MTLRGTASANDGRIAAGTTLSVAGGELAVSGDFDPAKGTYRAKLRCNGFPLGGFLPGDSLGCVALALEAEGTGV